MLQIRAIVEKSYKTLLKCIYRLVNSHRVVLVTYNKP